MSRKYIRLDANIADNKKIKKIRNMQDGNDITLFWVLLLALAGQSSTKGKLTLVENMPYTTIDLAEEFNFTHNFVRKALNTLYIMKMIHQEEDVICITNWDENQTEDEMERVRRLNAERNKRYRERLKYKGSKGDNVTITSRNVTKKKKAKTLKEEHKEKIKEVMKSFSGIKGFTELNKEYWDVIRETRQTGKVAHSVIYNQMKMWMKYDPLIVEYALQEHIDNHAGKQERYTIGIMRGTTVEEVEEMNNKPQFVRGRNNNQQAEVIPEWFKDRDNPSETETESNPEEEAEMAEIMKKYAGKG